jgi:GcrA cell cycle regulator
MPQPPGPWTDDLINEMRILRAAGYNAREIAILLGCGLTRNAVIGKAWRLGLNWGRSERSSPSEREPAVVTTPRTTPPRTPGPLPNKPPAPPPPAPQAPPQPQAGPLMRRLHLLELQEHHCKWPIGDPRYADFRFCGNDKGADGPYCARHTGMAYARAHR